MTFWPRFFDGSTPVSITLKLHWPLELARVWVEAANLILVTVQKISGPVPSPAFGLPLAETFFIAKQGLSFFLSPSN